MKLLFSFLFCNMILCLTAQTPQVLNLANANLRLRWENSGSGWRIKTIAVKKVQTWVNLEQPSGEHTLLYSADQPKTEADSSFKSITGQKFPRRQLPLPAKDLGGKRQPRFTQHCRTGTAFFCAKRPANRA